ncbi:MAG: hypothetical protein BA863_05555, partial [Desulfovibrio sp. S3730MH75]
KTLAIQKFSLPPLERQKEILEVLEKVKDCSILTNDSRKSIFLFKKVFSNHCLTHGIDHTEYKQTEIGKLPAPWKLIKLRDASVIITKGITPTTVGYDYLKSGVSFVKGECINEYGNFDTSQLAYISEEAHKALKRSQLSVNDVLLTIAGTIGKVAIVNDKILPANTNQAIAIIRVNPEIFFNEYLFHFLESTYIIKHLNGIKTIGAQSNISLTQVGNFILPVPPLDEQIGIVDMINQARSIQLWLEKKASNNSLLSQNIFKKFWDL